MEAIFLLDTSCSMRGARINQLNHAMYDILTELDSIDDGSNEKISVRIVSFNNVAKFILGDEKNSVRVDKARDQWINLVPRGATDSAHATRLCANSILHDYQNGNKDKTIVVLVTDGKSSDHERFIEEIKSLKKSLSGIADKTVLLASVGVQDYDEGELYEFATSGVATLDGGKTTQSTYLVYKIDNLSTLNYAFKQIFDTKLEFISIDDIYEMVIEESADDEDW